MKFIIIVLILAYCFSPFLRMVTKNCINSIIYMIKDIYRYVRYQKWKDWKREYSGIWNFCGYFGKGKTLTASYMALSIYNHYKKYGKEVRILSNYELKDVPYIPLINFEQIVQIAEIAIEGKDPYVGTIVLIDEIELLLSHRKFASFPIELLSSVCQARKAHILCITTLQVWHMCDKAWRDISMWCVQCDKYWRFQRYRFYDAFDVENATSNDMVQCKKTKWFFVKDKHYLAYDTNKLITQGSAKNFISNDELLKRRGIEALRNDDVVKHKSARLRKATKAKIGGKF